MAQSASPENSPSATPTPEEETTAPPLATVSEVEAEAEGQAAGLSPPASPPPPPRSGSPATITLYSHAHLHRNSPAQAPVATGTTTGAVPTPTPDSHAHHLQHRDSSTQAPTTAAATVLARPEGSMTSEEAASALASTLAVSSAGDEPPLSPSSLKRAPPSSAAAARARQSQPEPEEDERNGGQGFRRTTLLASPPPRRRSRRRAEEVAESSAEEEEEEANSEGAYGNDAGSARPAAAVSLRGVSPGAGFAAMSVTPKSVRYRQRSDPNKTPTTSDGEDEGISSIPPSFRRVGRVTPIKRQEGELSLLVGGRRFIVEESLFDRQPDTMLGRMFGSRTKTELTKPNDNGDYVIEQDVTPESFAAILKFYKEGKIKCPPTVAVSELHDACRYFMIPFTHISVQCEDLGKFLHELSNTGAMAQFETFMLRSLLPAMARCAELGERSCHIVVLSETDTVEWDEDLPPTLGEQFAKVVHDSSLSRFLYSYENRIIAKKLLKEKGLKRIKIGIEGFPTFAERVKRGANGEKLEVEYHYDQRPFIKASWEKEESKSRHVDFQYVRTSSQTTNVLSTVMTS